MLSFSKKEESNNYKVKEGRPSQLRKSLFCLLLERKMGHGKRHIVVDLANSQGIGLIDLCLLFLVDPRPDKGCQEGCVGNSKLLKNDYYNKIRRTHVQQGQAREKLANNRQHPNSKCKLWGD